MTDYLCKDPEAPNLDHPDSAIRLVSVVHRFKVPRMTRKASFYTSFTTVGKHDKTRTLMRQADEARDRLQDAVTAKKISAERVLETSRRYQPLIHSILLSCKVQPEHARLDERLVFEWKSGIEEKPESYSSEAMMYDLVMVVLSEALGHAAAATEGSIAGEFATASRHYANAAGIFEFLANEQLPKWIAKGSNVNDEKLPAECHAPMAKALMTLFHANGQQMAVATLLMKEGTPNYGLCAKLCLGIAEQLETFASSLRREASTQKGRMDEDFFTLLTLQINVQKSMSLYFQARMHWEKDDYGLAIGLLSEATVALQQRAHAGADGVPDVNQIPALKALSSDLKDLRSHMSLLLRSYEKDNSSVYFVKVPQHVPVSQKLQEGLQMKKSTEYKLEEAEPVLLHLPEGAMQRSDSDLARQLQEQLNCGEESA